MVPVFKNCFIYTLSKFKKFLNNKFRNKQQTVEKRAERDNFDQ